ncbi:Vegetative incompatibility protein HET-E-1 [Fusarium oxysporum f. sp. cepae]|nr:Vegetative incompatibility protein HET-E-1 [Fusarium oxysporum f. sp. cepae]
MRKLPGDKYMQCLADLRSTDPRSDKMRIEQTNGGLLEGSYRWILNNADFQRWRNEEQSRLLWIKGDPGKGKTMLLCGIINELEKQAGNLVSYFFCQSTDPRINNATAVLRGLIYLLVDQQPSLISHVRKKYDQAGKGLFEDVNAWWALYDIFTNILQDPELNNTFLIIDALDECITDLSQLLDLIIEKSFECPCVKWIVSSRNYLLDMEEKLGKAIQEVRLCLELNEDAISDAVDVYIQHKVGQLALKKHYDNRLRDEVQQYLTSNAHGTFLWVALVYKELADPKVRRRHKLTKLSSFPPGLDSLYERMMKHITDSVDADLCKKILAIASVVYRPATLKELTSLVETLEDFEQNDLEEIIGSCGSFLTLREGVIYFVHQSAKDYLLDKVSDQIVPSGTAHQHHTIFSRSLLVMSRSLRRDMYDLRQPGITIDYVRQPGPDPLASARYSCLYWAEHLCDSNKNNQDDELRDGGTVHTFLKDKYLYWLEALSLLRSTSEGVIAVQKLNALLGEGTNLADLLGDARRFVLAHKSIIEIAPLQVYASALLFSPTNSNIRQQFCKEEPNCVLLKPIMATHWNACLQTLEGHGHYVTSAAFTPDGHRLASASHDRTVRIWDSATGTCLQTLEGHRGVVRSVAFTGDNHRLASASDDRTVKIWDSATGTCLQTLEGHGSAVRSVAFTADRHQLASASDDRTVKIWDLATSTCLKTLQGHDDDVRSIAFAPDGDWLASASYDHTVKIWNLEIGTCLQTLKGHSNFITSVAFALDGHRLASASYDHTVKIWDPETGACLKTLKGHSGVVRSVSFAADSRRLASASHDRTVKIWDSATGACLKTLEGHGDIVLSVAFTVDSQQLASVSDDRTVKIWDSATAASLQTVESHGDIVISVAFTPDGHRLASASYDHTVKIWDPETGACLKTLEGHSGVIRSVAFTADSHRLASASDDHTIKIWDLATGACLKTLQGHDDDVRSIAFAPNGDWLTSASYDHTVKIWDPETGACLKTLEGHGSAVRSVAFTVHGHRLASASDDHTVKIWDPATGTCLKTLKGYYGGVKSVSFTVDGHRLASGSSGGIVNIWDSVTGTCLKTLKGHGGAVISVAFTADSHQLASASGDRTVKIWDSATGACLQTIEAGVLVTSISFDQTDCCRLSTDIGVITIDVPSAVAQPSAALLAKPRHDGYGITPDTMWIVKDTHRVLWLPLEYRPRASAVAGRTVCIGGASGRVLFTRF